MMRASLLALFGLAMVAPAQAQQAVQDVYNAPFAGETAVTVNTAPAYVGRAFKANCTAAGVITWTYKDGSTGTWSVVVGSQTLPIAMALLTASTATCTYANLK